MLRGGPCLLVQTKPEDDPEDVDATVLFALIALVDIHPFDPPSKWTHVRPGFDDKLKAFCVLAHPLALTALGTDMPAAEFMAIMRGRWKLVDRSVPLIE